jgi:glutaredoxin
LAKQLLEKNNVAYLNIDVTTDKACREEMVSMTGQISVPVIEIDGEFSIGYNEGWLKQKLNIS